VSRPDDDWRRHRPVILNAEQVAELLQTTVVTVRRLARDGELPARKIGGRWVFVQDRVLEALGDRDAGGSDM
jgi:excisionase family DNA binding protein